MDKSRTQFHVRRGETLGDKLVWRYPGRSGELARQLAVAGIDPIPEQITVGYYRVLDEPDGAWCFMPVNSSAALAALDIDLVRDRICEDLAIRLRQAKRE
jgi:hypothetical protein